MKSKGQQSNIETNNDEIKIYNGSFSISFRYCNGWSCPGCKVYLPFFRDSCRIGLFGLSQTHLNGPSENSRVLCLETLAPGTATLFVEPNAKGNVRPLVQQLLGLSRWQQQSNKASVGLVWAWSPGQLSRSCVHADADPAQVSLRDDRKGIKVPSDFLWSPHKW